MKNDYSFPLVAAVILAGVVAACFTHDAPAQVQPAPTAAVAESPAH
jgi:hypothetical protein